MNPARPASRNGHETLNRPEPVSGCRGFTMTDLLFVVAGLGLTLTVAVPAFRKYMERARALEVVPKLKQISDGAAAYFEESERLQMVPGESPESKPEKRFPESTPVTPARSCCEFGTEGLCEGTDWDTPTWRALGFSIDRRHRFRFQFVATGLGKKAMYTARAHADLDCDGLESTFERTGRVDGSLKVVHSTAVHAVRERE
jgi:type II secretory pathway pseudopilin PulG